MTPSAPHNPRLDPALDAAALLRRIGFATLVLAIPMVALVSRRAAVVLAPIGLSLLILAALIDGQGTPVGEGVRRALLSPAGAALTLLIAWAGLSLAWTPFPQSGLEKFVNLAGTALITFLGVLSLPQRMRSSNLYLMAIGTGAAVFFSMGLAAGGSFDSGATADAEGRSLERGLLILALFAWPAIGWLASRDRRMEALILSGGVLIAALIGAPSAVVASLVLGGLAFGIVALNRAGGPRVVAGAMAATIVAAPLLPFILRPILRLSLSATDPVIQSLNAWSWSVARDPLRLVTGHGLDASFRGRLAGMLPADAPTGALFVVWHDLGIVGVGAAMVALAGATLAIGRAGGPLAPAKIAALTTAFVLAILGPHAGQAWWLAAIGVVALAFVAAERGQFRTERPKARLFSVANDR